MTPVHQLRGKPHQLNARAKEYMTFIASGKTVPVEYTRQRDPLALTRSASFESKTEKVKTKV